MEPKPIKWVQVLLDCFLGYHESHLVTVWEDSPEKIFKWSLELLQKMKNDERNSVNLKQYRPKAIVSKQQKHLPKIKTIIIINKIAVYNKFDWPKLINIEKLNKKSYSRWSFSVLVLTHKKIQMFDHHAQNRDFHGSQTSKAEPHVSEMHCTVIWHMKRNIENQPLCTVVINMEDPMFFGTEKKKPYLDNFKNHQDGNPHFAKEGKRSSFIIFLHPIYLTTTITKSLLLSISLWIFEMRGTEFSFFFEKELSAYFT